MSEIALRHRSDHGGDGRSGFARASLAYRDAVARSLRPLAFAGSSPQDRPGRGGTRWRQ